MAKSPAHSISPDHPYQKTYASRPKATYGASRRPSPQMGLAMLKDTIPLTTFLGLGALLQYLVTLASPPTWWWTKWVLPLLLILAPWVKPTMIHYGLSTSPDLDRVMPGKWMARMPGGEEDPTTGRVQSPEFVIFMIGARFHGPFGRFSSSSKKLGKAFNEMWAQLSADPDSGLLNVDMYLGTSEWRNNKFKAVAVFRSKEDLWKFARGPLHSKVWTDYYNLGGYEDRGYEIWHEMFVVKEGGFDGIYANHDPSGNTMANIFRQLNEIDPEGTRSEEGDRWKSILVPIDSAKTKTSAGRMGQEEYKSEKEELVNK
ncbi:BZ3500_MvSof-1268-A1-R1_Chr11-2g03403 [Microbotryum saponariae]|uniref:BZ3500_MvSof-1268-A1-R1_Chr11-2g03403 protein n=1 Tax=Microbotryum saponariae TaxID=289078 RepID=A0A2X0LVG0_9BASI|nr:BZ3500_MvSof-1268-A1-R1_Chr11-2g03403 [Microbotryum saponariae]SDA03303.1 BZ3501_MvSof-1269-A2-R1_Chr11g02974 [Microbotryum saponariae]